MEAESLTSPDGSVPGSEGRVKRKKTQEEKDAFLNARMGLKIENTKVRKEIAHTHPAIYLNVIGVRGNPQLLPHSLLLFSLSLSHTHTRRRLAHALHTPCTQTTKTAAYIEDSASKIHSSLVILTPRQRHHGCDGGNQRRSRVLYTGWVRPVVGGRHDVRGGGGGRVRERAGHESGRGDAEEALRVALVARLGESARVELPRVGVVEGPRRRGTV